MGQKYSKRGMSAGNPHAPFVYKKHMFTRDRIAVYMLYKHSIQAYLVIKVPAFPLMASFTWEREVIRTLPSETCDR